ncbi:MAG: ribonuclease R [Deltaproteobacteria bacterium]
MTRKRRKSSESPQGVPSGLTVESIENAMKQAGRPLFLREIVKLSGALARERAQVRDLVRELVEAGRLVLLKEGRYGLADEMHLVTGRIMAHPDGFAFLVREKGQGPDIFIPAKGLKGAVHKDRVVVRLEERRGRRIEGSVLRILDRGNKRVVGTFRKGKNVSYVIPEDERLHFEVVIPRKDTFRARDGMAVVAEIEEYAEEGMAPEGRIVEILGDPEDMDVQARIVAFRHDLPSVFPDEVVSEAEALPSGVREEDLAGRKDLRDLAFVTIDGENARDFDDAVHVKKTRTGYVLTVAIADVSHYVQEGSPLDISARERGTSVYFPGSVIPMLPEAISNHLCSLVPEEDRLAVAVTISYDRTGAIRSTRFHPAVIRSRRRFTYGEVSRILSGDLSPLKEGEQGLAGDLLVMEELARILMDRRRERGSVDFDLPESYLVLGLRGKVEEIVRRERNISHQLIEEFMIAANEAVANRLFSRGIPTLYRTHGEPDRQKIHDFIGFARTLGLDITIPDEITPRWCQEVLSKATGADLDYVINIVLLRSMQQAVYSPKNTGHFGLASPAYLHFTSPIRRYPDLIVHRILKANARRTLKRPLYTEEALTYLGEECSKKERNAMEAEREMVERLKVRFMKERIGETFEGIVSGVAPFGFFVELREIFIEGAVRLVDLANDYYRLDQARHRLVGERTGRVFQIGDQVTVRVKGVNISRRHINFEVVEG